LAYSPHSIEGRLLAGELEALGKVNRWISVVTTSSSYWQLRPERLDLHQEILRRVIESLRRERFDASQDFCSYVKGVTRYTALQMLHRLQPHLSELPQDPRAPEGLPDTEERLDSVHLARQVLGHASPACRDLLRAYFFEQNSYARIAGDLQVPVGTVKSRLFRCLESAHQMVLEKGLRGGQRPPLHKPSSPS
jgi:RNA polymerase sigma factor (sigma-70 family)